ncbi:hypothetical protein COEREDRAFT_21657, partial [Coemansia reversa NRRL 1564]
KLRLSAYWNKVQADNRFAKGLHKKFGRGAVLIIGNWSAGMVRFHKPIRGKGWRDVLRKHGFTVYLLDEYKTSSLCPARGSGLEKFHKIPNPRPWQRVNKKDVLCNGLLRCKNEYCLKSVAKYKDSTRARMWNRDTAAVLNFRHILQSLWESGCVLEHFQCPMRKQPDKTNTKRPLPSDSDDSDS